MPEKTPDQRELDALLADLEALRKALREAHAECCAPEDQDFLLGVFRLLPGLGTEQWAELAGKHGLSHWLTLPVTGSAYPHLKAYQETLERLTYQTDHDPLTGLANRRAFERSLDMEIERARRGRQPVCLALLDLDDFKAVNDTYGHLAGDEVLRGLSRILDRNKRRYDLAARVGGEEFALVLSGVGLVRTREILERVLLDLSSIPFLAPDGRKFSVTVSAGMASYKGGTEITVAEFTSRADKALYQAKGQGKNRVAAAPLPGVEQLFTETLVHAREKRFLFGKREKS